MTDITPSAVWFEYNVYLAASDSPNGEDYPLPVSREPGALVISEDMDRDNFVEVILTLDWLDEALFDALDPRELTVGFAAAGPVRVGVKEYTPASGAPRAVLPEDIPLVGKPEGEFWPRTLTRDYLNRTVRLVCTSREAILDDALRIQTTSVDTAATTVAQLVTWTVDAVFGGLFITHAAITSATALPAGDRRRMQPGESHLGLIRSELDALNCRIYDNYGVQVFTEDRDASSGAAISLATAPGLQTDADPIVYEMTETRSRDGRWADGVLVKFDMTSFGGTVTWQASAGGGASTKGLELTRQRPAPVGNAATKVQARSLIRGKDLDVTARARLDVRTRRPIVVWTQDTYVEGSVRAVEWSFPEGIMRLRVQS